MPITNTDPLLGLEVHVIAVESGGFLVRQTPAPNLEGVKTIETFCANMDAVSTLLGQIYTPPPGP
jgi:hypothetical protein